MKMKNALLIISFLLVTVFSYGQQPDTSWKKGGFVNINFTQVSLNQWAQGGENSLALASSLNLFANYVKDKTTWSNALDLGYALLKSGSQSIRKSDDRIDLTSKWGYKFADKWYYSALFNFKSQFAEGFQYPNDSMVISKFLSPGYAILAIGINYKPVDYFELFLSPATGKLTIVNDKFLSDVGAYGVKPGHTTKIEFGAYLNMKLKKEIMTNVTLYTKLELFNNYTDENKDNQKNIDVNWETGLNMKVNKLLSATLVTQLIYDDNIIKRTQFKELIGVGLGYKF